MAVETPYKSFFLDGARCRPAIFERRWCMLLVVGYEHLPKGMPERGFEIEAVEVRLKGFDIVRDLVSGFVCALQDRADVRDDLL